MQRIMKWTALHVAALWNLHNVLVELAGFGGRELDPAINRLSPAAPCLAPLQPCCIEAPLHWSLASGNVYLQNQKCS
jgi:hypothetical protein